MAQSKTNTRFSEISMAAPDAILGLTEAYVADPNPDKMNLAVGVYKDASGQTPILQCVKEAERRLVDSETTKGYLPIDGPADYRDHVRTLMFGDRIDASRIAVAQTPGGTGALRVAANFLLTQLAPIKIWMPTPTWANHPAVFAAAALPSDSYRYLSADRTSLDLDGMLDDLKNKANAGDAVLLHACCHNPSGVDPSIQQWHEIADVVAQKGLLPVIDFAYQGFGSGLDEDAAGLHAVLDKSDEAIVCSSFSKNFGLYSERVGAISLVAGDSSSAQTALSQLKKVIRTNYSNPPRHGGAIVATVLSDPELTRQWHGELDEMRTRIATLRQTFVDTMKSTGAGHDFSFLLPQKGMFSFSGLNQMQVDELKNKHSIYIVGSGRINVAGMVEDRMERLCQAVAGVIEG
tara:strand:+ start:71363 stop:72577 length:1215 start_codon:yes stop_codon:yes gene_type:complete